VSLPRLAGRCAGFGVFAAGFVLCVALLHPLLAQPPVGDATSGLFPSAIVLASNGFDLADLLARPGWSEGGPNVHPFSLPTWLTALALYAISDDLSLLRFLHLVHFAIAACVLLGTFRLACEVVTPGLALALTGSLLLFPLFQVQAGYLYTEMPLAACTVWAVLCAARRRWRGALVWSALACFTKEAGVVVPVALALAAALEPLAARRRFVRVAAFATPPLCVVFLQLVVALPAEAANAYRPPYGVYAVDVFRKLAAVPDLAALLAACMLAGLWGGRAAWRALCERGVAPGEAAVGPRVLALSLLAIAGFVGFYALVPLTGAEVYLLPRYYVQIAPFVLLTLVALAQRVGGRRLAYGLLGVLAGFFVLNRNGVFYSPVPGNEFSLAERSFEYRELLSAQRRLVDAAAALPAELPVFYGLPEHFLFSYARMGYARTPLGLGHCVWLEERYRRGRLSDYPERFAILYDFAGYGGNVFQSLVRQARADPTRRVRSRVFAEGRYRTVLFLVSTVAAEPGKSSPPRKVQP
jgi:hypothetical protein